MKGVIDISATLLVLTVFIMSDGVECRAGKSHLLFGALPISCPLFPCPNPGPCARPGKPYNYHGIVCYHCPSPGKCDLLERIPVKGDCDFQCLHCIPPPGYVSPGPDKNGCIPCPPCGNGGAIM